MDRISNGGRAPVPKEEPQRLAALRAYNILDTAPEQEYDDIVRLAAFICGTPCASVSFIDEHRQWLKSSLGLDQIELPRDSAFCSHTIVENGVMVVPDAATDTRFADNPLVTGDPHIRFYAGAPIISESGHAIGALCVIDKIPRTLNSEQKDALHSLARHLTSLLKIVRLNNEQKSTMNELVRTHAALSENEERLRRLTDVAFEGVAISQDGVVMDVSPAYAALFGYPCAEEMVGLAAKDLVTLESLPTAVQRVTTGDEEPYEARLLRRDGTTFVAEIRGRRIHIDGKIARVTAVRDISERRALEETLRDRAERLRQSEASLRAVLESAPVILYSATSDGTITLSEGTGLAALGLEPGEAVGHSVFEFNTGDPIAEANTRRALAGESISYDGYVSELCLHTELRPLKDAEGAATGIIGVCYDITELKRAEQIIRDDAAILEIQKRELEKANAELSELASIDSLTRLKNHGAFQERLAEEIDKAARYSIPLSLILLDVDRFKQYNDVHGHPAGDTILQAVARILEDSARAADIAARCGGEEFAIILPNTMIEGAAAIAERIRFCLECHPWPLTAVNASFGVASLDNHGRGAAERAANLIVRADEALYQSKTAGRNRVTCSKSSSVHA